MQGPVRMEWREHLLTFNKNHARAAFLKNKKQECNGDAFKAHLLALRHWRRKLLNKTRDRLSMNGGDDLP